MVVTGKLLGVFAVLCVFARNRAPNVFTLEVEFRAETQDRKTGFGVEPTGTL